MVCFTLNYIEHFLSLVFAITVCISIFTIGLKVCTTIAKIKKYKQKEEKKEKEKEAR